MKTTASSSSSTLPSHQKHILVPIDFSPESVGALRAAVKEAEKSSARLTLLNIVESCCVYRGQAVPAWNRRVRESHGQRMAILAETEVPATVPADLIVGDGEPPCEINRIAKLRHVDCIVLGEHQHHNWWGSASTARKVADSALCEVIVLSGGKLATVTPEDSRL